MSETMNMCLSGGAEGADTVWANLAREYKHQVVHWSFKKHNIFDQKDVSILDDEKLLTADSYVVLANKNINRKWPTKSWYVNNLIRRNFYQVNWADSVYAISTLIKDSSLLGVKGGTAWACQMYIDRWLHTNTNLNSCYLYLFDQNQLKWFSWKGSWTEIVKPPTPQGVYAGIGTREINNEGIKAIIDVYR